MLHICSEDKEEEEEKAAESKKEKSDKKKDSSSDASSSSSSSSSSKPSKKDSDSKSSKSDDKKSKSSSSDWGMTRHSAAVLSLGLISIGEDIGSEMAFRMFGHLYRYGDQAVRRAVPLALALTSVSNPPLHILDTLSKFSHDSDAEVVHNSIFGMALVGAGTNNARLAQMLRNLAVYYSKDHSNLFLVRLAQGLVHLGKGTMTVQPYHSDRQLMCPVALAGILSVIISFFDVKTTILGKSHYLLFTIVPAIQPRMLVTFDEELNPLQVSVRVGQAVDVVGQAGKPKTITGFQTHTTPVLLAYGERAELATEEYHALTPVMEGFVILRKNPDQE
jgi:26S proteasome regulatory subunit N1